jgi:hypothetical protein
MRRLAFVTILAGAGCTSWSAQRAVMRHNQEVFDGIRTRDLARLRELVAADFLWHAPDGKSRNRDEWLKTVKDTPGDIVSVSGMRLRTEVRGDRVVLCGVQRAVVKLEGRELIDDGPFCDDWQQRDGRWQIVAAYVPTF